MLFEKVAPVLVGIDPPASGVAKDPSQPDGVAVRSEPALPTCNLANPGLVHLCLDFDHVFDRSRGSNFSGARGRCRFHLLLQLQELVDLLHFLNSPAPSMPFRVVDHKQPGPLLLRRLSVASQRFQAVLRLRLARSEAARYWGGGLGGSPTLYSLAARAHVATVHAFRAAIDKVQVVGAAGRAVRACACAGAEVGLNAAGLDQVAAHSLHFSASRTP